MRRLQSRLMDGLIVLTASIWFGNSGFGLAILWLASRGHDEGPMPWQSWLSRRTPVFAHVGTVRLLAIDRGGSRLEVFRDEVSASEWSELKRRILAFQPATGAFQPATGRNTSS